MLDVDIARFLCACGLEPTPEAIAVARRLWEHRALKIDVREVPYRPKDVPPKILDTSETLPRVVQVAAWMPQKIKQERKP